MPERSTPETKVFGRDDVATAVPADDSPTMVLDDKTPVRGGSAGADPETVAQARGLVSTVALNGATPPDPAAPPVTDDAWRTVPPEQTFYRLPAALADRYDIIEEVGSGGQGVVLRCHDEVDGEDVAIKLLNRGIAGRTADLIAQLRDCDPEHVVPILDADPAGRWEVQEFFPLGTLAQVGRDFWTHTSPHGGSEPTANSARIREFLTQAHAALTHVHSRQILHQDLKPANIFVRSLEPLDIVLGDFGLARRQDISEQVSSRDGTLAYQSPEYALAGRHSAGGDWWALGMILHILLTGRHVYAGDGGRIDSRALRAHLFDGDLPLDGVRDPRWRHLIDGLLTRELRDRWGAAEVAAWLDGRTPPVVREESPRLKAARTRSITLLQRVCSTPEEVAAALGVSDTVALDYLRSPAADELAAWLDRVGLGDEAAEFIGPVRRGQGPDERNLVALQAVLDPETSPRFSGRGLSMAELFAVADQASDGDERAGVWIARLRTSRALTGAAQVETHAALAMVDERLRMWWSELEGRTARLPDVVRQVAVRQRAAFEGFALGAALSEARRATLLKSAETQRRRAEKQGVGLPESVTPRADGDVVAALLTVVLAPDLVQRHRAAVAEEDRVRAQVAKLSRDAEKSRAGVERRAMRSHRWADNVARLRSRLGWHGAAAVAATAAVGFLGPETLPVAATAIGIGYVALLLALFVTDVVSRQGRGRLPRLLGLAAAVGCTAYVAAVGAPGTAGLTTTLALAPPAGYMAGYAVGALAGWLFARAPRPPSEGRGRDRVGALVALVPASVAVGWLLERAGWLGIGEASLPEAVRGVALAVNGALPTVDLPGPLAVWWGVPILLALVWLYDPPGWARLGPARPWLAGLVMLLSGVAFLADPVRLAVGLVFGGPALVVLLVVLGATHPRALVAPPLPSPLGPPPLA